MDKPPVRFYAFGQLRLDTTEHCLIRGEQIITLTPKLFGLLQTFLQSGGRTLSKDELAKAVWPDTFVTDGTLSRNISRLREKLGDCTNGEPYIETLSGHGYRFIAKVTAIQEKVVEMAPVAPQASESVVDQSESLQADHRWYILLACILYAALYAVALLVEIAYEWDQYGRTAGWIAVPVSGWVLVTSATALLIDRKLTGQGNRWGLVLSGLIFVVAAAMLFASLCRFLPPWPITQASFQTYTAQGAYLKETVYFLILAGCFLVAPFHFVAVLEQRMRARYKQWVYEMLTGNRWSFLPKGKLYPALLLILLLFFATKTSFDHTHLFDNLTPAPHRNLFIQLMYVRLVLYFALGIGCLVWFYRALDQMAQHLVATDIN